MSAEPNRILKRLLDRLFASLVSGPSLNCRPHSSRQRFDLVQFAKLKNKNAEQILRDLLGPESSSRIIASVPAPRGRAAAAKVSSDEAETPLSPEEQAARDAYSDQQSVLTKLRGIAEDAKLYENDTGVHVLQIGFPLLSIPPGSGIGTGRRVLAPLAFMSLSMTVKSGASPSVTLECRNEGADLVVPNIALMAWLEQQTGQAVGEMFADDTGEQAWKEIASVTQRVCTLLQCETPELFTHDALPDTFSLVASPRADDTDAEPRPRVITSAVIGLYPMSNQGLLRDMQALVGGETAAGPIESFIKAGVSLEPATAPEGTEPVVEKRVREFSDERLVTVADPCQARAVKLARTSRGLVIHGPPGTGKSQTIANVIGDHLGRGERVLFVCEKRTALDVVMNRLESMGLGALCAIVHDPQRDQRDLYRSIREQLDGLVDLKTEASADGQLKRIDAELQKLHTELTEYHRALMVRPDVDQLSFHELMGHWLSLPSFNVEFSEKLLADATRESVEEHAQSLADLFDRAAKVGYVANPWTTAAGISLETYLSTPVSDLRAVVSRFLEQAKTCDSTISPGIPPFPMTADPTAIATARVELADRIESLHRDVPASVRERWSKADAKRVGNGLKLLDETKSDLEQIERGALDRELLAIVRCAPPAVPVIAQQTAVLDAYVASSQSLLGIFAFGKKSAAAKVLSAYGLQRSPESATRVRGFLAGLRARLMLGGTLNEIDAGTLATPLVDDESLVAAGRMYRDLLSTLDRLRSDAAVADLAVAAADAIAAADMPGAFLAGLRASPQRAAAIVELEQAVAQPLLSSSAREDISRIARANEPATPTATALSERFDSVENVLRVREAVPALPDPLRPAVEQLVRQNVAGDVGLALLRRGAAAVELTRRLKSDRRLMTTDAQQLSSSFGRYLELDGQKKVLTRHSVLHQWATTQKSRLVVQTGSRLNSAGADLRRRLTMRGDRAMRLRQVIAVGQEIEGGDPLFDLRPVWMASPETVAQIFPRTPLFDIVIFDEASQCRLEEALPVLLRAKRVVIAGDPKQLPPTRFFESAVAASDQEEIESDQQLFEVQQAEIEDLLGAALNIEIEECYLDVHYRSRNSDLIQFSNENFYNARLQAIPGHPKNRSQFPPLTLYKAGGVYEKRANLVEAEKVCQIVRDLLRRAEPPSIGIACFNITQRDAITDALETAAEADREFGRALAIARERRGPGSFEGLFVKNLENVQGDERDHMIISTTYGPDASGKFYRRFGPLGSAGGGRRLNVLVTRAREEVHLVTSIPETVYRHLPPLPAGTTPGGAWLLFSYLIYAEQLADLYDQNHRILEQAEASHERVVNVRPTRFPSVFARQLAQRLHARHDTGSDVHWGNDGFCVDLALHHPTRIEDVTIGVMCDMNRFEQAADPVEWEVFRNAVLESQGWKLHRVWTPSFFRDRTSALGALMKDVESALSEDEDPHAIRVSDRG